MVVFRVNAGPPLFRLRFLPEAILQQLQVIFNHL